MSRSFNLTAELNLRGPSNIRPIIADIRRQLTGITANVNVTVNNTTTRNVNNLQQSVTRLNTALTATRGTATNATAALNAFARAAANVNNNIGNIPRNLTRINTGAGATTTTLNQVTRATQQATVGFEDFGRQSALAVRRFAAFAAVTSVIYKFTNAVTSATSEFIDFNRELVRVAQVTDSSLSELTPLVSQITNLSTSLGVASKDLIQVSSTLAQAGLSARDTEKALRALALSALAPSFDSLSDTVEGSIALMRQFGISAGDLEDALGSVNSVAAKFAVEASDLITAIQRTGGVFATASKGVSEGKDALNEFLAVFTSIRATTRESAETIATGLRTIFTRIQRADTIDALKAFGVTLTDLEGKFVGPYEAVRRLSEGLSRLDPRDLRFSQIVEELGGFRQIGKVIPLIQQFATAQAALKVAQQGQGSLAKDASTAQQSLANQIAKVREEFTALIRSLGESSTFQTFVRLSLDLASALIRLADSAKTVLPALTAIAAFRGVSALTRFGAGFAGGLRRQNNGGPVRGFARGGVVPGVGNGDTVPAMLEPGEFVIRKRAVATIGADNLHKMNSGRKKFAIGGGVHFSHLDAGPNVIDTKSKNQRYLGKGLSGVGIMLPDVWNLGFAQKNWEGISGAELKNYIANQNVEDLFARQIGRKRSGRKHSGKTGSFRGGAKNPVYDNFIANLESIKKNIVASVQSNKIYKNNEDLYPIGQAMLKASGIAAQELTRIRTIQNPQGGYEDIGNKDQRQLYFQHSTKRDPGKMFRGVAYKKSLGGIIQKFARGGKGKALGARSRFKELDESELAQLSTSDLIKYAKRQARDIFSTGGAGMAIGSRFIETPANKITPELEPHLTSYMGKKGFWREEIAPFGRPSKQQAAKASKTGREEALKKQEARQADEVAARAQQWKLIRSGSKIDSYLLSSLKDPILSDYKSAKAGQPLAKAFHETRLRQAVNKTLDDFDDFDYSPAKIDKLVSGMAAKRFGRGGKASSDFTGYHGSAHIFSKIDASKLGKRGANLYGAGFNIAMDRGMAKSYAKKSGAVYPVTVKGGISDFIEANSLLSENPKALQSIQKIFKQQKIPVKGLEQLTFKDASNKLTETLLERIEKKLPKKPGVDANSRFMEAFGIASQKVRQLMVVGGIPGTKVTINRPLDEQMAVAYDLDRLELGKPLKSKRFARGGSVEDKVPALLTPGEFVINKKAASRIGGSRLHQLNRADRIQGFNKGGAVGGIQKMAAGGFPTALTPAMSGLSAKETARLSSAIMNNVDAFNTLEAQVSALPTDQMLKAMRIFASKLEGGATDIDRAATEAATLAQSGGGGSRQSKKTRVANSGVTVGPANPTTGIVETRPTTNPAVSGFAASQARIDQISANVGQYQRGQDVVNRRDTVLGASSTVNLSNAGMQRLAQLNQTGGGFAQRGQDYAQRAQVSSQKTYAASSFDPTQLYQGLSGFNKGIANAANSLTSLTTASKSAGGGLMSLGKGALGAVGRGAGGLVSKIGGKALNMVGLGGLASKGAGAAMGGGGGGGMMGMMAMMAAGPLLDAASQSMGGEKTQAGRNTAAVGGSVMNYAAIGATLGSVIPGVGTALGGVVGAAAGLVVGLQDAKKANEEYAQSQREATAATASDKSGKALEAYMAKPGAAQKQAFMSSFAATSEAEAAVKAGTKRQTASSFGKMLGYQDENINDFAARTAKTQTAGADQAKQFLTAEMMRTGKNFGEISKTMSPEQFKTLATNIAEADETYAYFQIQRANEIKKLRDSGRGAEADALQAQTNAEQENLAKNIAERQLAEASAAAQAKAASEASKKLNMVMMQAVMSLEKSFNTMEEVLNRSSFELGQISGKADEIFSGKASLTSSTFAQTNNVLQNPNAYSAKERQNAINSSAARMGPAGALVGRVATFGAQATEEASRRANAVFNGGGDNEAVGNEVTRSLTNNILATFGPNSSMSQTLIDGVKRTVDEAVQKAKDDGETLDPNELVEKATGPLNKAAQQAGQLLIKNNENVAKHLEELGKVAERVVEIENRRVERTAALVEMQAQGGISTKEALGQKVSLDERMSARFAGSRARLGIQGQANFTPQNIANMRSQAQREQAALQSQIDRRSKDVGSDPTGRAAREVANLQLKLAKVNSTIEQTNKELEDLPGALEGAISDVTSEIQNRVAKLDAQKQASGAFAEKLVGSTPQELAELGRTFNLLDSTLRGQITTVQQSQVAQQAYIQSIQEGKTAQEAMADAQTAFANENKKALSLFGELTQIAGIEGPELDLMKADLLENFAKAQGAGLENNPFFQRLLGILRQDPAQRAQNDPVLKALQARMTELREQQVEAVRLQNEADRGIQKQLLEQVGQNIITSLEATQRAFVAAMNDIAMRMGAAPPRPMPARPRSTGGLIYASNGQYVNFQPKGTDTVPAMLTPGEFVVNAKSTKENLGLLMSINNSRGGRISYLANGGMSDISGVSSRTQSAKQEDMARSGLINQRSLSNKIDTVKSLSNNINSTTSFTKDNQIPSLDSTVNNNQTFNSKQFGSLLTKVDKVSETIEESMLSRGLSGGGIVYAADGKYINFQPKGTDTVPAMLTPGEFVVNAKATKDNLSTLQAINTGYYERGGITGVDPSPSNFARSIVGMRGARINQLAQQGKYYVYEGNRAIPDDDNGRFPNRYASVSGARNIREAIELAKQKYEWFEEGGYSLKEASAIERGRMISTTLVDKVIDELQDQIIEGGPRLFGSGGFNQKNKQDKINEIIKKIDEQGANPEELYRKATKRQNYLRQVENNTRLGLNVIAGSDRTVNLGGRRELLATKVLEAQRDYAQKELSLIPQVWGDIATMKGYQSLQRDYTTSFNALNPSSLPGPEYFDKGGIVYAQYGNYIPFRSARDKMLAERRSSYDKEMERRRQQYTTDKQSRMVLSTWDPIWKKEEAEQARENRKKVAPQESFVPFRSPKDKMLAETKSAYDAEMERRRQPQTTQSFVPFRSAPDKEASEKRAAYDTEMQRRRTVYTTDKQNRQQQAKTAKDSRMVLATWNPIWAREEAQKKKDDARKAYEKNKVDKAKSYAAGKISRMPKQKAMGGIIYAASGMSIPKDLNSSDPLDNLLRKANETKLANFGNTYESLLVKKYGKSIKPFSNTDVLENLRQYQEFDSLSDEELRSLETQHIQSKINKQSRLNKFNSGGIVYANKGTLVPYQPKGTDTVPAMLTPGEFVVNRQASQKHLGLLQSINNGNYSRGGTVYLAEGTPGTQAFDANMTYLSDILKKGADTLNTAFIEAIRKLNNIADNSPQIRQGTSNGVSNNQSNPLANIEALGNRLDQFIEQLKNAVPSTVTLEVPTAIPVNVNINGASILKDVLGGPIGNIVQKAIKDAFDAKSRQNEGY